MDFLYPDLSRRNDSPSCLAGLECWDDYRLLEYGTHSVVYQRTMMHVMKFVICTMTKGRNKMSRKIATNFETCRNCSALSGNDCKSAEYFIRCCQEKWGKG